MDPPPDRGLFPEELLGEEAGELPPEPVPGEICPGIFAGITGEMPGVGGMIIGVTIGAGADIMAVKNYEKVWKL